MWKYLYEKNYISILNDLNKKTELDFVLTNIIKDPDALIKEFDFFFPVKVTKLIFFCLHHFAALIRLGLSPDTENITTKSFLSQ